MESQKHKKTARGVIIIVFVTKEEQEPLSFQQGIRSSTVNLANIKQFAFYLCLSAQSACYLLANQDNNANISALYSDTYIDESVVNNAE